MSNRARSVVDERLDHKDVEGAYFRITSEAEGHVRASLAGLNVKPAYIEAYIDDVHSFGDIEDYLDMSAEAIQADYQEYVVNGGLE
jgi:hypothetical protein